MNQTLEIIHGLRTIHGDFSNAPVSDEDLKTILEATVHSASANARQPYSIVVVSDPDTMAAVCGYRASRMLVYCVDYTRLVDLAGHLECTFESSDLFDFITGWTDTALAVQSAVIAAHSLGIDTLTTNGIHRGDVERVYQLLGLPEKLCFPVIALLLGYRGRTQGPQRGRLEGTGIVHWDRYRRLTPEELDAVVAAYDDPKRNLGLISDWRRQRFKHYLEWFFKRWNVRQSSEQLYRVLERAGFLVDGPRGNP